MKKRLRIAVLMGGRSPEYNISLLTGKEVIRNLNSDKYEPIPVVISSKGNWLLADGQKINPEIVAQEADVVFIALHGPYGEDGVVQGILEFYRVPFTGSGLLASAIGMNKPIFRQLIKSFNIRFPNFFLVQQKKTKTFEVLKTSQKFSFNQDFSPSFLKKESIDFNFFKKHLSLPLIIKPASQGSSIGVSIVAKGPKFLPALEKAFKYGSTIMVEEFIDGIEVTCGLLGNDNPRALPLVEIFTKRKFFDYQAKYQPGLSEEIVPARLNKRLAQKIQDVAKTVYQVVGCQGFGRVDMIVKDSQPYVLEINTIPGLTPNSLFPKAAFAAKISYSKLLDILIKLALEKKG